MRQLLMVAALAGLLSASLGCKALSQNRGDVKFKEVERLFASIPIYPGSSEVDSSDSSKEVIAHKGKAFSCEVSYPEMKDFYIREATQLGWQYASDRPLRNWVGQATGGYELKFRNGEYQLTVEYAGDRAETFGWDYGVTVSCKA